MRTTSKPAYNDVEQPFLSHLVELRDRLLRIVYVIIAALVVLLPFSNTIYAYVAAPLITLMPVGTSMIAVGVAAPFMVPFKLTLLAAVVVTIPHTLHQIWAFVAPGLYQRERVLVIPLLVSSTLLFYVGMAFAYYLVFPMVFGFFVSAAPPGVAVMTDIGQYLDFVLTLFIAFGITFEIPIATILLVWMGVLTPASLVGHRSYVIVAAFVIGMFLTPPDAFSQTMLAIPMWLLFEAGVFFSRYFVPAATSPILPAEAPLDPQPFNPQPTPAMLPPQSLDTETDGNFRPLTVQEMATELHDIELAESHLISATNVSVSQERSIELKLAEVHKLRQTDNDIEARALLYQVLMDGNEQQRVVARNILEQLDLS